MKLSKSVILFLVAGLVTIFVVSVALKIYWSLGSSQAQSAKLFYTLTSPQTDLKVGDKIAIPVYLSGQAAAGTTAFDIKFYYDVTKLKLTNATPGAFFDKFLTVKWDAKNAWFALAMTPSTPRVQSQPNSPLLTLEFTTIAKSTSTAVSTGASTVYITKTGGFHPQSSTISFTIK